MHQRGGRQPCAVPTRGAGGHYRIVDGHDRLLLQHNAAWKDSRLYSVSAGFVEAGENLEHACRREAMEETGIKLGEVRYLVRSRGRSRLR